MRGPIDLTCAEGQNKCHTQSSMKDAQPRLENSGIGAEMSRACGQLYDGPDAAGLRSRQQPKFGDGRSMIAALSLSKIEPGLYEYQVYCNGQELFSDAGYESIQAAIEAASDTEGPITAMEVAYSGVVGGTFTLHQLRSDAAGVASRLVDTVASVLD